MENSKYILTEDTGNLFSKVSPIYSNLLPTLKPVTDLYLNTLASQIKIAFNNQIEVITFAEEEIEKRIQSKVRSELDSNPDAICICLDRFLLKNLEKDEFTQKRFYRFNLCRTISGEKIPRQGTLSFKKQFDTLLEKVPDISKKQIVVVDDGIFTGGTVKYFYDIATRNGVNLNFKKIIGFIGSTAIKDSFPFRVDIIKEFNEIYEWIDIRDFTPLAGKTLNRTSSNRVTSSIPYLFPWSDGSDASLQMSPYFYNISEKIILSFKSLLLEFEKKSGVSPLTFRDLIKLGFPLPTNLLNNIPVSINDYATNYLDRCLDLIEKERQKPVIIFDLDGTLYQLDGEKDGFKRSSLDRKVRQNALSFICDKEGCNAEVARGIYDEGVKNEVGLSLFLAKRYGIKRKDFFDIVWKINPKDLIKNYETASVIIPLLKKSKLNTKIVLLTSAPSVWAKSVLKLIGIEKCFENIYTGEQYDTKREIFEMLSIRYNPDNVISVGDQLETDILPAQKFGIKGFRVTQPENLWYLVNEGEIPCY